MSNPAWQDPNYIHFRKEEPRTSFIPYPDLASARRGMREFDPMYLSLNGSWNFHYFEKDCLYIILFLRHQEKSGYV